MRDGRSGWWRAAAPKALAAAVVALAVMSAAVVSAQVQGLYYKEVKKDGTIFVFNTYERYEAFEKSGEMGQNITLVGHGPQGETVVAENATALDLFNFKHDLPSYDRPTPRPASAKSDALPFKVGVLGYISYQDGRSGGKDYSKFVLKRGYLNVESDVLPFLSVRWTTDITQDSTGDVKPRMKYLYGRFKGHQMGFVTDPMLEFGLVHMPWLDYEEAINGYRMQDTMFTERNGLFNSADFGITIGGLFGGKMPEEYQKTVSSAYPGRYGSFMVGVYNGTGYHAAEHNTNKVLEGRVSIRPLPDVVPGLQLSYFGIHGKGNTAAEPDWNLNLGWVSYESRYFVITGQYLKGKGNQAGTAVDSMGKSLDRDGWSVFADGKITRQWSVIARYDHFDPNTTLDNDAQKRTIGGVAYHLGKGNILLLDYEQLKFDNGSPTDKRGQLTLQVKF